MKTFLLIITILANSPICFAQTDSSATNSVTSKSTLTLGAIYSNNASYYGQRAEEKTPYAAVAGNYQLKSGIYFTAQTYKLLNDTTSDLSAASFGAGVNFKVAKKITADLSYSHSFYPSYSPLLQAANTDNGSLSLSYQGWITPVLTGDYAFGKTNDAFMTASITKQINLFSISTKDIVTISPSANVVGGSQHFYETYLKEKKLRDSLLGLLPVPILGARNSNHTDTVISTAFNVLSYSFKLPVAYNRKHYSIEVAYQLSFLSDHVKTTTGQINSFLTFSFYYQF